VLSQVHGTEIGWPDRPARAVGSRSDKKPRHADSIAIPAYPIAEGICQFDELPMWFLLDLSGTQVTGRGLSRLKKLSSLRILHLRNTQVSDAAIAELKTALPELRIGPR
jgi:hypothetical protein